MTLKTKMEKIICSSYKNIGGLIVLRDGEKVYENYLNDCTSSTSLHVFSVTKSIVSILIGIAMKQGYIESLDQRILDFFPEYEVRRGETTIHKITLKDMMTMTAPYRFKTEPYNEYFKSSDWVKAALDGLGGKGGIGDFRYAGVIGPDIFTGILTKVTGQGVLDYARDNLLTPLGITIDSSMTFHSKEEHLEFYKKRDISCWATDPNGVNTGGWGLTLKTNDMVKIGQLYLNQGACEGQQLVPSDWVAVSTREHSRCKQWGNLDYGYLWWIIDSKERCYAAMGDGGNVIYVNETKKLVVAIASLFVPNAKIRIKLIQDYIEPAFL